MSPEPKTNILMVDDQPKNLFALEAILESLNENLVIAQSGQEALEYLLKSDFAVILLDIQMPGLDGYETAELIRKREKSRNTPIIFVTAINKNDEQILKGYSFGAVDYICKPIDPQILKAKVAAFVDIYKSAEDSVRQTRLEAEEAKIKSLSFLSEASHLLSTSLDYVLTLKNIADLCVPYLADYCIVDLVESDGKLRQVAVADISFDRMRWLHDKPKSDVSTIHYEFSGLERILNTGQSELVSEVTESWLKSNARDPEQLELMRRINFKSYMIVPLVARGRTLGLISLVSVESGRCYSTADLILAEDLAGRSALAVDNAWLYKEAQSAIELEQMARKEAEEANRLKDEFIATLSHELKTPLQNIIGWSQLLLRGCLDDDSKEHAVEIIDRNAKAQSELINDLLDISRIITGQLRLNVGIVDPVQVIEAAISSVRPAAEAKKIAFKVMIEFGAGYIWGDANRLQQVIWNLLLNSIKFTPNEGQVNVHLERIDKSLEITVSDTGKGISPDFLPHVFERFRQADGSITRTYGGLGLGLAIVKHLMELMGGTVSVSSEGEERGATFKLRLPVMNNRSNPVEADSDLSQFFLIPKDYQQLLKGLNLLVVDDELDTCEMLKVALEQAGANVKTCNSARDALGELLNTIPDVIVSDISMPGENGYELIQKVRKLERINDIPAVALTSFARSEDRINALRAGYQMHVAKPVDPIELVAVIASLTGTTGKV
jgi:signal transduction histidine kinase/DNA-binding response OmpR family regulator